MTLAPFGEWLPDQPSLSNPGAVDVLNVLPHARAYGPMRDLAGITDPLTGGLCRGSAWARSTSGTVANHSGTASTLEVLSGSSWTDASKAGGYTNAGRWEWVQIGDRLIAVSPVVAPQFYDLGVSTQYADLPGSPPTARHAAVIRNFVVLGNLSGAVAQMHWSGFNNSEIWSPSISTQSDTRELAGRGGEIKRIVPGAVGWVFQENSIWRMRYTGPPTIFTLDEVHRSLGTPAEDSVSWIGSTVYFLGTDGFFALDDGALRPIGHERVNRWFQAEIAQDQLHTVRSSIDRRRGYVLWTFPSSASLPEGHHDRMLVYNWVADKWARAELTTTRLSEMLPPGYSLDDLTNVVGLADIDSASIPVDSDIYAGGSVISVAAFDASNRLGMFDGPFLRSEFEGADIYEPGGRIQRHHAVRPMLEPGPTGPPTLVEVQRGTRSRPELTVDWSAPRTVEPIRGTARFRGPGRISRFRLRVSGGFGLATGLDVEATPGGWR